MVVVRIADLAVTMRQRESDQLLEEARDLGFSSIGKRHAHLSDDQLPVLQAALEQHTTELDDLSFRILDRRRREIARIRMDHERIEIEIPGMIQNRAQEVDPVHAVVGRVRQLVSRGADSPQRQTIPAVQPVGQGAEAPEIVGGPAAEPSRTCSRCVPLPKPDPELKSRSSNPSPLTSPARATRWPRVVPWFTPISVQP